MIIVLVLEQEELWEVLSTTCPMTYCPTYVCLQDVLHKLTQNSDYSMDNFATVFCQP